jgi:hypothetical protein
LSLHGSFGSGLAMLAVDEEVPGGAPRLVSIPCEAGPTIRALRSAFGDEVAGQEGAGPWPSPANRSRSAGSG